MESITPAKEASRYPSLLLSRLPSTPVSKSKGYSGCGILLDKRVLLQTDTFGVEL